MSDGKVDAEGNTLTHNRGYATTVCISLPYFWSCVLLLHSQVSSTLILKSIILPLSAATLA